MKTRQYQIAKKVLVLLPFYLFTFLPLFSQTFTQRIQQSATGEGTVSIHHDAVIDELVNNPTTVAKPTSAPKKTASAKQTPTNKEKAKEQTQVQTKETTVHQEPDTLDTIPKRTVKTTGYRVQVLAGGNTRQDRQRAEQAGRSLRSLFPGEEVYVHFYPPRWICRLGNYRTYEEAHEKMLEVRKLGYDAATIVKGKITVTESIK